MAKAQLLKSVLKLGSERAFRIEACAAVPAGYAVRGDGLVKLKKLVYCFLSIRASLLFKITDSKRSILRHPTSASRLTVGLRTSVTGS